MLIRGTTCAKENKTVLLTVLNVTYCFGARTEKWNIPSFFFFVYINTNTFVKQSCALHDNIHKTHIILPDLASEYLILSSASRQHEVYSMYCTYVIEE